MKHSQLEQLVYSMLTENTGTHMLDSGGSNGRMWQRNQKLSIEDFKSRPECTLELSICGNYQEAIPTVDVFHYLTSVLELDSYCDQFNSQPVSNWDSDTFYGVSSNGEDMILSYFEIESDNFNTYNYNNNFSQVMQGRMLKHIETGDTYVLLQIHGGADVRGGYTDAKLFKLADPDHYFGDDKCYFECCDWLGEWVDHNGSYMENDSWDEIFKKYNVTEDNSVTLEGSICY